MARKKTLFDESLEYNQRVYGFYMDRLAELSVSSFEWINLPASIDPRFLEMVLFTNGSVVFFKDEDLQLETGLAKTQTQGGTFLALPVAMNGRWNVYNVPTRRRAYASNGYNRELTENDSVIIFNNMIRTNSEQVCKKYAKQLYELDRTIEVNCKAQKTPVLIQCDEPQRLTMLNLYKEYDGNQPYIFGYKNLDLNAIKVLKTDAPLVAPALYDLKTKIWNEALTYLGISNMSYQKKERLLTDEVDRTQGGTVASRYSRLNTRKEACKKINEMFGLNIDVKFKDSFDDGEEESDDIGGEAEDEHVHD